MKIAFFSALGGCGPVPPRGRGWVCGASLHVGGVEATPQQQAGGRLPLRRWCRTHHCGALVAPLAVAAHYMYCGAQQRRTMKTRCACPQCGTQAVACNTHDTPSDTAEVWGCVTGTLRRRRHTQAVECVYTSGTLWHARTSAPPSAESPTVTVWHSEMHVHLHATVAS